MFLFPFATEAQNTSVSITSGYQSPYISSGNIEKEKKTASENQYGRERFKRYPYSAGSGISYAISLNYNLKNPIFFSLKIRYLNGFEHNNVNWSSDQVYPRLTFDGDPGESDISLDSRFFSLIPAIGYEKEIEKFSLNLSLGLGFSKGEIYKSSRSFIEHDGGNERINFTHHGGYAIGFSSTLGVKRKLGDKITVFSELEINLGKYTPAIRTRPVYQMYRDPDVPWISYPKYVTLIEEKNEEPSFPLKPYPLVSYPLNTLGINLGVTYFLWKK